MTLLRNLPTPLATDAQLPIDLSDGQLDTPSLLVDLDVVDDNIARMATLAHRSGLQLRPHAKSHKSVAMARRQLAAGAVGICVSSVTEAHAMLAGGISDVLIAYPIVGERKLSRLAGLLDGNAITLVSDSEEITAGYRALARTLGRPIPVMVEIDTGMNRAGVNPRCALKVAGDVARGAGLIFRGVLTHAGHSHDVADQPGIEMVAREEAAIMGAVREELETAGIEVPVVSAGSTITAPYLRASDGITEIRPGTYIYNDLRTLGRFACTPDEIGAVALATVVSLNGDRVTLDAGSKTLTTAYDDTYGFGYLRGAPDARFTRLSEEHGVLSLGHAEDRLVIGQRVEVLPVHVCVWMDLQPEIYGVRNGRIVERIAVDAMRHSL